MNYLWPTFFLLLVCSALSCSGDKVYLVDTIPPAAITDFRIQSTDQAFSLSWTAPGGDGTLGLASRYDIRYAATNLQGSWNSAAAIPSPPAPGLAGRTDSLVVQGIGPGPWEFGIRTGDSGGNWSRLSNIVTSSLLADTIPPAAISDLSVRSTGQGIYLRWTAPGDDGETGRSSQYDIRYVSGDLATQWETATVVSSPPVPGVSGQTDSVSVLGIGWGPWEFGIRTSDNVGNLSDISNIVVTTIPVDTTPPTAVTDLAVDLLTERSIILIWTAVGDDGTAGRAAEYDLRYALDFITSGTWASASKVQGMDLPGPSGARESFSVTGLDQGTNYHFALVVLDDVQNPSGLSNQVVAAVPSPFQVASGTDVYGPDWSPDGASIVFTGGSPRQLFVIPPSGGTPIQYTSASPAAQEPSWSPDGSRIAFDLYVDGGKRSVVALMSAQPYAEPQILADHDTLFVMQPRWSPDGTEIAYALYAWSTPFIVSSDIYVVPSDGGLPQRLTGGWPIFGLDWSPDGSQIVFSANRTGTYDLWLIPSTGGTPSPLLTGPGKEWNPRWSPDGSKIAFIDQQGVWVISSAGGTPIQVTFGGRGIPYGNPSWSPDGSKLAFGTSQAAMGTFLWILPVR